MIVSQPCRWQVLDSLWTLIFEHHESENPFEMSSSLVLSTDTFSVANFVYFHGQAKKFKIFFQNVNNQQAFQIIIVERRIQSGKTFVWKFLDFSVTQIFTYNEFWGFQKCKNLPFQHIQRLLILIFVNFCTLTTRRLKLSKWTKSRAPKTEKWQFLNS